MTEPQSATIVTFDGRLRLTNQPPLIVMCRAMVLAGASPVAPDPTAACIPEIVLRTPGAVNLPGSVRVIPTTSALPRLQNSVGLGDSTVKLVVNVVNGFSSRSASISDVPGAQEA